MNEFVTIASFTTPSELVVAKTKLLSEGIECRTVNELTIQSHNFLSNAIGGVKLQVLKSDFDRAYDLLIKGGFIKEEHQKTSWIYRQLENPKTYNRLRISLISILVLTVLITIGALTIASINQPSAEERIGSQRWCLDFIVFNDFEYAPYTFSSGIRFSFVGQCNEEIMFNENGSLEIPGFNSRRIEGKWEISDYGLRIYSIDTLENIFEGTYDYRVSGRELLLKSENTEFYIDRIY